MFHGLSDKPYENMAVKHHVFQLELLFEFILVYEGGLKFSFPFRTEFLNLYLLGKNHSVL